MGAQSEIAALTTVAEVNATASGVSALTMLAEVNATASGLSALSVVIEVVEFYETGGDTAKPLTARGGQLPRKLLFRPASRLAGHSLAGRR